MTPDNDLRAAVERLRKWDESRPESMSAPPGTLAFHDRDGCQWVRQSALADLGYVQCVGAEPKATDATVAALERIHEARCIKDGTNYVHKDLRIVAYEQMLTTTHRELDRARKEAAERKPALEQHQPRGAGQANPHTTPGPRQPDARPAGSNPAPGTTSEPADPGGINALREHLKEAQTLLVLAAMRLRKKSRSASLVDRIEMKVRDMNSLSGGAP